MRRPRQWRATGLRSGGFFEEALDDLRKETGPLLLDDRDRDFRLDLLHCYDRRAGGGAKPTAICERSRRRHALCIQDRIARFPVAFGLPVAATFASFPFLTVLSATIKASAHLL